MEPAYRIPLDRNEFAMLGELTAIMGLIDEEMTQLVTDLLEIDRDAGNIVMASTRLETNYGIWAAIIAQKTIDAETLWLVKYTGTEMSAVQKGRNDFIHAVFREDGGIFDRLVFDHVHFDTGTVKARRVKKDEEIDLTELPPLLRRAARLSCLVAHISHVMRGTPSPWNGKFDPELPPRPVEDGPR